MYLTNKQWQQLRELVSSYGIGFNTDSNSDADNYILEFLEEDIFRSFEELFEVIQFTLETLT